MKIRYDQETDTLTIILRDVAVAESDEGKRGAVLDYDAEGNLVAIELMDASGFLEDPTSISVG